MEAEMQAVGWIAKSAAESYAAGAVWVFAMWLFSGPATWEGAAILAGISLLAHFVKAACETPFPEGKTK
jgi:hypothetical protein